jgi:hypothetical protein
MVGSKAVVHQRMAEPAKLVQGGTAAIHKRHQIQHHILVKMAFTRSTRP